MINNKDSVFERIKALKESSSTVTRWYYSSYLSMMLIIGVIVYYSIVDRSIVNVPCPHSENQSAPVMMYKIQKHTKLTQSLLVKDFVKKYVKYLFPRKSEDAKLFLEKIIAYSEKGSDIQWGYQRKLDVLEKVQESLEKGSFFRATLHKGKNAVIISRNPDAEGWIAEVDLFLDKYKSGGKPLHYVPKITIKFHQDDNSQDNLFGLYVDSAILEQVVNYQTGEIREIRFY